MARDKEAIRNKPDDPCILYWIKDASCTDIALHGYVGITHAAREQQRQREHRRAGRLNASAEFIVLHRGTRLECTEVENRYRPDPNIGWNRSKGGGRWRNKKTSAYEARVRPGLRDDGKSKEPDGHQLSPVPDAPTSGG